MYKHCKMSLWSSARGYFIGKADMLCIRKRESYRRILSMPLNPNKYVAISLIKKKKARVIFWPLQKTVLIDIKGKKW